MDFSKYQGEKTKELYKQVADTQAERLQKQLEGEKLLAVENSILRTCEFDLGLLESVIDDFHQAVSRQEAYGHWPLKSTLSDFIRRSHASYLAPACQYHAYIELLARHNINQKQESEADPYAACLFTIHVQNIFLAVKCMLDRLVPVLSYYYNGISVLTTFGRTTPAKPKNMMSVVAKLAETDPLMGYIWEEYHRWIKEIIDRRDTILHYNDMRSRPQKKGSEIPIHFEVEIFSKDLSQPVSDRGHTYLSLRKDVQCLYDFLNSVFSQLAERPVEYRKEHFLTDEGFENYKKFMSLR